MIFKEGHNIEVMVLEKIARPALVLVASGADFDLVLRGFLVPFSKTLTTGTSKIHPTLVRRF
jgi:hypothetical protein